MGKGIDEESLIAAVDSLLETYHAIVESVSLVTESLNSTRDVWIAVPPMSEADDGLPGELVARPLIKDEKTIQGLSHFHYDKNQEATATKKYPAVVGADTEALIFIRDTINPLKDRFARDYKALFRLNKSKRGRAFSWAKNEAKNFSAEGESQVLLAVSELERLCVNQLVRHIPVFTDEPYRVSWHWVKKHTSVGKKDISKLVDEISDGERHGYISAAESKRRKDKLVNVSGGEGSLITQQKATTPTLYSTVFFTPEDKKRVLASMPVFIPLPANPTLSFKKRKKDEPIVQREQRVEYEAVGVNTPYLRRVKQSEVRRADFKV